MVILTKKFHISWKFLLTASASFLKSVCGSTSNLTWGWSPHLKLQGEICNTYIQHTHTQSHLLVLFCTTKSCWAMVMLLLSFIWEAFTSIFHIETLHKWQYLNWNMQPPFCLLLGSKSIQSFVFTVAAYWAEVVIMSKVCVWIHIYVHTLIQRFNQHRKLVTREFINTFATFRIFSFPELHQAQIIVIYVGFSGYIWIFSDRYLAI